MYTNLIFEDSELFLPVGFELARTVGRTREAPPDSHALPAAGLAMCWAWLRVGYHWGGDGECLFKVTAQDLCATVRHPDLQQTQARAQPIRHCKVLHVCIGNALQ